VILSYKKHCQLNAITGPHSWQDAIGNASFCAYLGLLPDGDKKSSPKNDKKAEKYREKTGPLLSYANRFIIISALQDFGSCLFSFI
jgi:hypothetical protein